MSCADFDFIRAEAYTYAHVADEGHMHACAGALLRYRRALGADTVGVVADIRKKHWCAPIQTVYARFIFTNWPRSSHALTADLSLADLAHGAEFNMADGVVLTGAATGQPARAADIDGRCTLPSSPACSN